MDSATIKPSDRSRRLDEIVTAYLKAVEAGEQPDPKDWLERYPDLTNELGDFFAGQKQVAALAGNKTIDVESRQNDAPLGSIRYFGDYELLQEIARGGMGVVYKARQISLNRMVALKMILQGELADKADMQRFQAEAEAAANLDHPHIVPIYEIGIHEGRHYFSMKLIGPGQRKSGLGMRESARVVAVVARAVHHAHQRGILHRDLKPGNILFDERGEPHVADFGLAKRTSPSLTDNAGDQLTKSGAIVGTPSYMAPEQATATKDLSTAVDVYSLGVILYEWLTGRLPFQAVTPLETLMLVIEREPEEPSRINPKIDVDLQTICLKCLEKQPERRYRSAAELAEDLERWLSGEPILARPTGRMEHLVKWVRRKPAVAALLVALVLSLLGGTTAATLFAIRSALHAQKSDDNARTASDNARKADDNARTANANARQAETNAQKAMEERSAMMRLLYAARMDQAERAWETGQIDWLQEILDGQRPENTGKVDLRGFEWYYWNRLTQTAWELPGDLENVARSGFTGVIAYHPAGSRLARTFGSTVTVHDADTGKKLQTLLVQPVLGSVHSLVFSPDGKELLASGANEGEAVVVGWTSSTGKIAFTLPLGKWKLGRPVTMARSQCIPKMGTKAVQVLATAAGVEVVVWDLDRKTALARIVRPEKVTDLVFSPDGSRLAVARWSADVEIFDTMTGEKILTCERTLGTMNSLAFSPDGRWLAGGGWAERPDPAFPNRSPDCDKAVTIWDAATGKIRYALHADNMPQVEAVAFSPDSRCLASSENSRRVILWDVATGLAVRERRGLDERIRSLAFRPSPHPGGSRHLTAATYTGRVRVWDLGGEPEQQLLAHDANVQNIAFSPDGKLVACALDGRMRIVRDGHGKTKNYAVEPAQHRIALWDRHTSEKIREFPQAGEVRTIAFSPDGRLLAAHLLLKETTNLLGRQRTDVWEIATGKIVFSQEFSSGHDHQAGLAFSPDGKRLAYLDASREDEGNIMLDVVRVRDLDAGKVLWTRVVPFRAGWHGATASLAFSASGNEVAAVGFTAVVWNAHNGEQIFVQDRDSPQAVAFHPKESTLAIADRNQIELIDFRTHKSLAVLKGHDYGVSSLSFSRDGRRLASAAHRETGVRLWDLTTCQTVMKLPGRGWVAFSADGTGLAAGGEIPGAAVVWNIDSKKQ